MLMHRKRVSFALICLAWVADMGLLAVIGPLGRHPWLSGGLYGSAFVMLVLLVRGFPRQISDRRALLIIFTLGISARLFFLVYPPNPDIYRYIWEGIIQNHGFNPYAVAPDDPMVAHLAQGEWRGLVAGVNHRWMTAIYPPAAMLMFRLLAWISPAVIWFKTVFLILDLGVMTLLVLIMRMRRLPVLRLLVYAANPLVIVFICGEGHLDALQIFFLCLGCYFLLRGHAFRSGLSLGMSAMSKYLALAAVPFFWQQIPRWRKLSLFLPIALVAPYADAGSGLFESLGVFGQAMHYNDGIGELIRRIFEAWAAMAAAMVFALWLAWTWLTEDDCLHGAYLALGGLLLLLFTLHPWYLALMTPFLCLFPSAAWLYLQAAMLCTFPVLAGEFETGVFREIIWLKLPEYLPFYALMIWGLFRNGRIVREPLFAAPRTISVIIPSLNEADYIGRCLAALRSQTGIREIIVADGGSTDATASIATREGAQVLVGQKGRGVQIRPAAGIARGDVLLILHADAVLHPGASGRLLDALAKDPGAAGGCFGMEFDSGGRGSGIISALNNFRAAATGIVFGDQAQFVRAAALKQIGGFPDLMLMEDVELSLRLKTVGTVLYLRKGVAVSGRRWQAGRCLRNLSKVVRLFLRYLLQRRLDRCRKSNHEYYRAYYGSST
jgi:rSAM/selenodomain-associated transferase 2